MNQSRKFITCIVITIVIVGTLALSGAGQRIYASLAAEYPESWMKIQPGITSHEARQILGEPYADGRGLKSLDRWEYSVRGVEVHLDLWFDEESSDKAIVTRVVLWKHFLGVDASKSVDPPWQ